jgi:3-hydroxyisobutyrate dehydrogenase-like beta-hydroxyacid dehydrogenase
MSQKIGILGLGNIGSVWAKHHAAAGALVGTWNRSPKPDAPEWRSNPADVARAADIVQIVVADPPAVAAVIDAILPELRAGKIVVQSSTIDPESSERFRQQVIKTGARYLEAPFVGSKPAAEARKNVYYLGGDEALAAELDPVFARVAEARFYVGDNRQAASLKLALNLNIGLQMEALAESITFARRAGISDDIFFRVLEKNVAFSPLVKLKEPKLRQGDFSAQFSIKHLHKDMRLAQATAGAGKFPLLDELRALLQRAEAQGLGDDDYSGTIQLLK